MAVGISISRSSHPLRRRRESLTTPRRDDFGPCLPYPLTYSSTAFLLYQSPLVDILLRVLLHLTTPSLTLNSDPNKLTLCTLPRSGHDVHVSYVFRLRFKFNTH